MNTRKHAAQRAEFDLVGYLLRAYSTDVALDRLERGECEPAVGQIIATRLRAIRSLWRHAEGRPSVLPDW